MVDRLLSKTMYIFCMLLVIPTLHPVLAQEQERGARISFSIDQESGGLELIGTISGTRIPLLFNGDPATTGLLVFDGETVHRVLQEHSYPFSIQEFDQGSVIIYALPDGLYSWLSAEKSDAAGNSLLLTWGVLNSSDRRKEITSNLLLDTVIGERSSSHFLIDDTSVNRELSFSLGFAPPKNQDVVLVDRVWSGTETMPGLLLTQPSLNSPLDPLTVVIANWKRLHDTSRILQANENRNFNLLPFSVNDSAMLVSKGTQSLRRGETTSAGILVTFMSDFQSSESMDLTSIDFHAFQSHDPEFITSYISSETNEPTIPETMPAISDDSDEESLSEHRQLQVRIRQLLDRINQLLQGDPKNSQDEIDQLREMVQSLRRAMSN